jgi:hypothetical protein
VSGCRGYRWRPRGRGLFELEGVPDRVLRHFSQRRVEIEQRAAELVGAGAASDLSRERMQGVATLEKPARTDYLRLGTLDRPAMLKTIIQRLARVLDQPQSDR